MCAVLQHDAPVVEHTLGVPRRRSLQTTTPRPVATKVAEAFHSLIGMNRIRPSISVSKLIAVALRLLLGLQQWCGKQAN